MLHHVTLEVASEDIERMIELWRLLGFEEVEPPVDLAATFTWLEHEGTQIHLMRTESPTAPRHGHVAVVVPDFAAALERLRASDFKVVSKRERWGSPRAEAIAPGGHRVELMETPPGSGQS
jgi:catechol 2,3-dioxygenase-like lactoylglutathione lyase family enzyme